SSDLLSLVGPQQGKACAGPGALAGLHERPPIVGRVFFEEENLEMSAGFFVEGAKAGGNDFGIVQDEDVTWPEKVFNLGELVKRDFASATVEMEQSGLVASR